MKNKQKTALKNTTGSAVPASSFYRGNDTKTLIVFGKPGVGKDTVSNIIRDKYNYAVFHADRFINGDYLETLRLEKSPTDKMRIDFIESIIPKIRILNLDSNVVVNYTFNRRCTQDRMREAFPKAKWLYVDTARFLIEERLEKHPRTGHVLSSIEQVLSIGDKFEYPFGKVSYTLLNDGSLENLLEAVVDFHRHGII